jgi:hypothetical protein
MCHITDGALVSDTPALGCAEIQTPLRDLSTVKVCAGAFALIGRGHVVADADATAKHIAMLLSNIRATPGRNQVDRFAGLAQL